MTDGHDHNPAERLNLTGQDLAIATLAGRYIERRDSGTSPATDDLLAIAAEFGEEAVDTLRTLLAYYEAMRASEDDAR